jgi:hypothetical protein
VATVLHNLGKFPGVNSMAIDTCLDYVLISRANPYTFHVWFDGR